MVDGTFPGVRVRFDLAYDGTDFSGWARQPGRRTVQDTVERALATVLRLSAVKLTVAGRTDAGVHARGQVAHADLSQLPDRLVRRLNGVLPADVRVTGAARVPDAFDARFGALWRRYEYLISDAVGGPDPLRRRQVVRWPRPLDGGGMAEAATRLIGLHDFVAFCRRREGATTVRSLERLDVARNADGELVCTVVADAFCHSMVRSLVGALLAVGDGRRPVNWPAALLANDRRADEVVVAPAHGLTLAEVGYPAVTQLAGRAAETRALRVL